MVPGTSMEVPIHSPFFDGHSEIPVKSHEIPVDDEIPRKIYHQ
jgi:hypothetical protein